MVQSLKDEILELLEKDKEFRLAVSGLIGYKELIERLAEHDRKFEEIMVEIKGIKERMLEHDRKFEEIMVEIRRINERLESHDRKFEEIMVEIKGIKERMLEHDRKFEEIGEKLEKLNMRVEVTIGSMGRRWGWDLERMVLQIFKEVLEREGIEPGRVRKFRFRDEGGEVTGRKGSIVDVDVLIEDEKLYILEVKSHVEIDDIERLADKVPIVETVLNRKASKVYVVAVNVNDDALQRAEELGIRSIYGHVIPKPEE